MIRVENLGFLRGRMSQPPVDFPTNTSEFLKDSLAKTQNVHWFFSVAE
jgi:hypothetical protein